MIFDSIVFDLPGKQSKESEGERGPAHTLLEPIVPYLDIFPTFVRMRCSIRCRERLQGALGRLCSVFLA